MRWWVTTRKWKPRLTFTASTWRALWQKLSQNLSWSLERLVTQMSLRGGAITIRYLTAKNDWVFVEIAVKVFIWVCFSPPIANKQKWMRPLFVPLKIDDARLGVVFTLDVVLLFFSCWGCQQSCWFWRFVPIKSRLYMHANLALIRWTHVSIFLEFIRWALHFLDCWCTVRTFSKIHNFSVRSFFLFFW